MRRREFIGLLGGAAAIPIAARAQQSERMRRIGVLMFLAEDDPGAKARIAVLIERLHQLDWTIGHNVQIDIRWGGDDAARARKYAAELVATAPDVILATASETTAALREATRTLPIVFVGVTDPVGAGYVSPPASTYSEEATNVHLLFMPEMAVSFLMESIKWISGEAQPHTSIEFFVARSRRTYQSSSRPSMS